MKFNPLKIIGAIEIIPRQLVDNRGKFIKTYNTDYYKKAGITDELVFKEEYFSVSKRGALRGLHFQVPPHDHHKLIYCIDGQVQDIIFDLRKNSPTYGKSASLTLNSEICNVLFIPKGIAHGFLTLSDQATLIYKTTSVYNTKSDSGIHWKSCEDIWQLPQKPILSDRDEKHPMFNNFISPFTFQGE